MSAAIWRCCSVGRLALLVSLRLARRSGTGELGAVVDDQGVVRKFYGVRGTVARFARGRMTDAAGGTITQLPLRNRPIPHWLVHRDSWRGVCWRYPATDRGMRAAMLNPSSGDAASMTQSLIAGIRGGQPDAGIDNTGITPGEATEAYAKSSRQERQRTDGARAQHRHLRATLEVATHLLISRRQPGQCYQRHAECEDCC